MKTTMRTSSLRHPPRVALGAGGRHGRPGVLQAALSRWREEGNCSYAGCAWTKVMQDAPCLVTARGDVLHVHVIGGGMLGESSVSLHHMAKGYSGLVGGGPGLCVS